jgi:hypothetical protein
MQFLKTIVMITTVTLVVAIPTREYSYHIYHYEKGLTADFSGTEKGDLEGLPCCQPLHLCC